MDRQTVESMLVKLAVLCKKVMFKTTNGYEAEYAAAIGRETQSTLRNINNYSQAELSNIARNISKYTTEMNAIMTA